MALRKGNHFWHNGRMRIFKKIATPFENCHPTGAIIVINLYDPQLPTMEVFIRACKDKHLPYMIVGNKYDLAPRGKAKSLAKKLNEEIYEIALTDIKKTDKGLVGLRKKIEDKFQKGDRIIVLGVFNSGKTSLINWYCTTDYEVGDMPGTTLEFTETDFWGITFIDSVGQLIDINKPMMVSIDYSNCKTLEEKITKTFNEEMLGLKTTHEHSKEFILRVLPVIKKQIDSGNKIIVTGAGASALVAKEMAGQGYETGLPIMVFTNELSEVPSISFAKGLGETEGGISRYTNFAINKGDIVIGISASGGTGFVYETLRMAREKGAITIAITENIDTPLGKNSDYVIKSNAKPEGPSSSKIQTAHLVIGHCLILLLAEMRGINAERSVRYMLPEEVKTKKMGIK